MGSWEACERRCYQPGLRVAVIGFLCGSRSGRPIWEAK